MPKPALAESLLALLTDHPRAAAIYGDLEEIAVTRSRTWFWTTYLRTLASLTWRTPVAFILAIVSMRFLFGPILQWFVDHATHHLSDPGLFGQENLRISMYAWNLSFVTSQVLCVVLPYVALRFGLRNRLTQLAAALFLLAAPAYLFTPWIRDLSGLLTVLAVILALALPLWRRPLATLAATGLTAIAVSVVGRLALVGLYHRNFFLIPAPKRSFVDIVGFALAALVCTRLYHRLTPKHSAIA